MIFDLISRFFTVAFSGPFWLVVKYVVLFYPIWLPIFLAVFFWDLWLQYVRAYFTQKTKRILLEVKLPKEILKSPAAMEIALNAFYQTFGETTFIDRYYEGKYRTISSLELVSIDGVVHFFIWIPESSRNLIESALYGQYPSIEIHEVSDYSAGFVYDPKKYAIWATEFALTKPDPYPIKTYIDYGLDKDPKEEFKHDPITPLLEFLGSIKKGEQVWFQIIIRAHKEEKRAGVFSKKSDWKSQAKDEIKKILSGAVLKPEDAEDGGVRVLSPGERELITGIERSISKTPFDCGIRAIYIAPKDAFNSANIGGVLGGLKQFSSNTANGFKPSNPTTFPYPWQDFKNIRLNKMKAGMVAAYKRRGYFFKPYKSKSFVLSGEELATLYHFPGQVASTPTFTRIPSKKSEPPSNLPI